jgi:hypothetical protein
VNRIAKLIPQRAAQVRHLLGACVGCHSCGRRLIDCVGGRAYYRDGVGFVYDGVGRSVEYLCLECRHLPVFEAVE